MVDEWWMNGGWMTDKWRIFQHDHNIVPYHIIAA
jgi:hypothetical protein